MVPQLLGRRDVRRLELLVLVAGSVGRGAHERLKDGDAGLSHAHGERLRAPALAEEADVELDTVEVRRAQEMAVEARGPADLGAHGRGAQGDRREIAAVGPPDLPRPRERDGVAAIVAVELGRSIQSNSASVARHV